MSLVEEETTIATSPEGNQPLEPRPKSKGAEGKKEEFKLKDLGDYQGYVWSYAFKATVYMYMIVFMAPAVLEIAKKSANSKGEVSAGVNASSILSIVYMIYTLVAIFYSPILGALCDYTAYRKEIVSACIVFTLFIVLSSMILTRDTWQLVTGLLLVGFLVDLGLIRLREPAYPDRPDTRAERPPSLHQPEPAPPHHRSIRRK